MSKYVEYCENSTITEAWAVLKGAPGKIQDSEVGALWGHSFGDHRELVPLEREFYRIPHREYACATPVLIVDQNRIGPDGDAITDNAA